jgi:microcystin degradation protein MlrC
MPQHRVAIGGIFTESNHLAAGRTELVDFERTELRRGDEVLTADDGVAGGALQVLRERGAELVPTLVTSTYPGPVIAEAAYVALKDELIERLRGVLPVDGVIVLQHGAAAVQDIGSLDGDLLAAIREVVGPDIPVVSTLDCHAHVTEAMVKSTDALAAWRTYPHRDSFETGQRGAHLLLDALDGKTRPTMALAKVPVIVSGYQGSTEPPGPFADVMKFTIERESEPSVLSTSAFLVQPHLNLPDLGGGGLAVTDDDLTRAVRIAREIAEQYWARRDDLLPEAWLPDAAIAEGLRVQGGPVLLLEVSDCIGGGSTGDSTHGLRALLEANLTDLAFATVIDPQAARACHDAGVGRDIEFEIGHHVDSRWGVPVSVRCTVQRLSDGAFTYSGGIWGGQRGDMGPAACVRVGNVEILIATHPTYDWADEQYASLGMETRAAKFVIVKNPMNYRVGYRDLQRAAFVLDTPGATTAFPEKADLPLLTRPFFPKDRELSFEPTVYTNQ